MEKKIATLALIVKDQKLLLGIKHRDAEVGANTLNGPGGKLESGETLLECVTRETEEEVGLSITATDEDKRAVIMFHNGKTSLWEVHVYLVTLFEGEPKATAAMNPDGEWWYETENLPYSTRMLASDGAWMPRVLAGERFFAHVYQNDDASKLKDIKFSTMTGS